MTEELPQPTPLQARWAARQPVALQNPDAWYPRWLASQHRDNEKWFAQWRASHPLATTAKPRQHRRPSLSAAIKRAKAHGMTVTVALDGSMTFKCAEQANQNVQNKTGNGIDLDRELEEFEALHGQA